MAAKKSKIKKYIRNILNWPKRGIIFRDITPLLADKKAFSKAVGELCSSFTGRKIDYVAAVEARGFIFGAAVAQDSAQVLSLSAKKENSLIKPNGLLTASNTAKTPSRFTVMR